MTYMEPSWIEGQRLSLVCARRLLFLFCMAIALNVLTPVYSSAEEKEIDASSLGSRYESIATNKAARDIYHKKKDEFRANLAPRFRKILDDNQANYISMGLSKREISAIFLQKVGSMAVRYGMEDLLDYALIKDESGISVRDSFPEEYDKYYLAALARGRQIDQDMAEKDANEKAAALNHRNKLRYDAIVSMTDPQAATEMINDIKADPDIDGETAFKMITLLQEIINRQGYPKYDNPATYRRLSMDIESGAIRGNKARAALKDASKELSQESFMQLNERITELDKGRGNSKVVKPSGVGKR